MKKAEENVSDTVVLKKDKKESVVDFIRFITIAVVVVVSIRAFIASPFIVSGASMNNSFFNGDYLIVDKLSYRFEEPVRGEVVVFQYPLNPSQHHIKRIIGIPGDTVDVDGVTVTITPAGSEESFILNESYAANFTMPMQVHLTLADDEYFVMGDNRDVSLDSRRYGALGRQYITGRVIFRLFPLYDSIFFPQYSSQETMFAQMF